MKCVVTDLIADVDHHDRYSIVFLKLLFLFITTSLIFWQLEAASADTGNSPPYSGRLSIISDTTLFRFETENKGLRLPENSGPKSYLGCGNSKKTHVRSNYESSINVQC